MNLALEPEALTYGESVGELVRYQFGWTFPHPASYFSMAMRLKIPKTIHMSVWIGLEVAEAAGMIADGVEPF